MPMELRSGLLRGTAGFGSKPSMPMELRSGPRLRRSPRLLVLGDGPDLISTLPDDILRLVLGRLGCAAPARTGVLSRRWRGLWARLRWIVINDVAFDSLEAALSGIPPPPPVVSLLQISLPKPLGHVPKVQLVDTDGINSVLRAAARLDPEEFSLVFPWNIVHRCSLFLDLPCFHRATSIELDLCSSATIRCVLDGVEFPALKTLSLLNCTADLDTLLSRCPLLRKLWLTYVLFHKSVLSVNSLLLQELIVVRGRCIDHVNIVAPVLTQLTMSLQVCHAVALSVLVPMVEKFSWDCNLYGPYTKFGVWILTKLKKTSEGQGQLSSLQMHARSSSIFHGEADEFQQHIEKHMIVAFSVLELHLTTEGHVYGAFVLHLLGMNRIRCVMRRLKLNLQRPARKEEGCRQHCRCDSPNWKSRTISLTSLEEVEITGFEGEDHEFDLLKSILRCAPMLKRVIMKLSQEASTSNDRCTEIYNIFRVYSCVECCIYLSSGLMHGSQNCTST